MKVVSILLDTLLEGWEGQLEGLEAQLEGFEAQLKGSKGQPRGDGRTDGQINE